MWMCVNTRFVVSGVTLEVGFKGKSILELVPVLVKECMTLFTWLRLTEELSISVVIIFF